MAHPRSRGENVLVEYSHLLRVRLIPAHAGKTFVADLVLFKAWGSSPLTRGKLVVISVFYIQDGLIPAHAGKTTATVPRH